MSALIYVIEKEKIIVAMDTLAIHGLNKRPCFFTNKIYLLPNISTIICGTGYGQFIFDWYKNIQTQHFCKDISYINQIAPEYLPQLWEKFPKHASSRTTVYHFGYSKEENCFIGNSFSSENNFASKSIGQGAGIKPGEQSAVNTFSSLVYTSPNEAFIKTFSLLKELDDKKDLSQKVGIGGQIQLVLMATPSLFQIETIYTFPDYEEAFKQMEGQHNN